MNAPPPIPISRQVRWRSFRTRVLPGVVFGVVLAVAFGIWNEATSQRNAVGIAEGARSLITTPTGGLLEEIHVTPYQVVRAGEPVAVVRAIDSRAQLDVLQMELDLALAEIRPSLAEDHALDYERIRLELLRTQTDLAVARVNLRRAENEERRSRPLYEEKLVAEDVYDLILQTREMYQEEVNAHSHAVAEIERRLESLSYLGDPQTTSDGAEALRSDRIVGYLRQPYILPLRVGQRVRVTTREAGRRQFWSEISHIGAQVEIITNTLAVLRVGTLWDSGLPFVVRLPAGANLCPGEVLDLAIQRAGPTGPVASTTSAPTVPARGVSVPSREVVVYRGMADASAGVAISRDWLVVADDEESILRLYDRALGGLPNAEWDLTAFLNFGQGGKEADIEGSARIGDTIYWVTSHGRNAEGKLQTSRHRFFATRLAVLDGLPVLTPHGRPCISLLDDLSADPRLEPFDLAAAATLPPKADGGLNLEGLCPGPEGSVLLGFRNPIPGGRALLLPLLNPDGLVVGERAMLGPPRLLNLGGYGIRSLERFQDTYYILAGSSKGGGRTRLYAWDGSERAPVLVNEPMLRSLNPEAITVFDFAGTSWLHALSDDGTRLVDGVEAKRLEDPLLKSFRGVSFPMPSRTIPAGDTLVPPLAISWNHSSH